MSHYYNFNSTSARKQLLVIQSQKIYRFDHATFHAIHDLKERNSK